MNEPVKDPLGVVAKWKAEEAGYTAADDLKYGWGFLALLAVLLVCIVGLAFWLLSFLF